MQTEKQKMLAGELYHAGDAELAADRSAASAWMVRYNASLALPSAERRACCVNFSHMLERRGDPATFPLRLWL